jgi:methyl-accepting chemotaxis protein
MAMTHMKRFKFYKRRFLVDAFQLRLTGVAAFHFFLVVALFVAALFAPVVFALQSGDISDRNVQVAAHTFLVLHKYLWPPLVGAFILLILHNILVTHRVAGPLVRLRRYLQAVGEGDLRSPIHFRKNDYLTKEATTASEMVAALREKIAGLDRDVRDASAAWREIKGAISRGEEGEVRRRSEELEGRLQRCRARMNTFRTDDEPASEVDGASTEAQEPVELGS